MCAQEAKRTSISAEATLLPFPLNVFPPRLAQLCAETATTISTAPDFLALTLLTVSASAIGTSRALRIKDDWFEMARLFAMLVGEPGSGKSPAMETILQPYRDIQCRLLEQHIAAQTRYNRVRQGLLAFPTATPCLGRLIVGDATVEALVPIHQANPRGLLLALDEVASWIYEMNQYKGGHGSDRQFWQSVWSGQMYVVDRKKQRGEPLMLPRPFINVIGSLQPDIIHILDDKSQRKDGFLDRMLFSFPQPPTRRVWTEGSVSENAKNAWRETLDYLRELKFRETEDGGMDYQVVQFSVPAKKRWVAWWNAHDAEAAAPDLPTSLRGPWVKLTSYAARLTLVLHYLWVAQTDRIERDVEADTVERAVELIDYFKSHWRRIYSCLRINSMSK